MKRKSTQIVGEVRVHRLLKGKIIYAEADLNRGGQLFAFARKSRIEVLGPKLGMKVARDRIAKALKQHRAGEKVRVKLAGYEPMHIIVEVEEST